MALKVQLKVLCRVKLTLAVATHQLFTQNTLVTVNIKIYPPLFIFKLVNIKIYPPLFIFKLSCSPSLS